MTSRWIRASLDRPIDVVMDVEPRNAQTMAFPGRSLDRSPVLGPMLARAMAEGKPVASDPLPLLHPDGAAGLVLAAPVLQEGDASPAGFVTFSYELAPLMLTNDDLSLFSVVLKDPRSDDGELIADDRGNVTSRIVDRGQSGALDHPDRDVRRPRLVAGLLRQDQRDDARAADRRDRGGDRHRADQHRLRTVRLCRLQQLEASPRNRGQESGSSAA